MSKSHGQINYEGHCRLSGVTKPWAFIEHEERLAWEAGAQAVAKAVLPKGIFDEVSTVKASQKSHAEMMDAIEAKLVGQ